MSRSGRLLLLMGLMWLSPAIVTTGAVQPAGQIIDRVTCVADPSQSYALFVPRDYAPSRAWPVIFAFDPGGRGRTPVERYQAAAEQYRFIVAGSHNSRNGSPDVSQAVAAMSSDVLARFQIDPRRVYVAGMSGGARVALGVALAASKSIAGVIASSAGYPDGRPRKTLPFPIFATAGTEDFNHLEMRRLDEALTSPHHLAIFDGGHTWLSSALAVEAVEWMELQAMKSGVEPRDDKAIDQIFVKRAAAVSAGRVDAATYLALQAIVTDFEGLKDVSALARRLADLGRDKAVRAALKQDRDEDDREEIALRDVRLAETRLGSDDGRIEALSDLLRRWKDLSEAAKKPQDSSERRVARRVLSGLGASVTTTDAEYLKIISEYRMPRGPR